MVYQTFSAAQKLVADQLLLGKSNDEIAIAIHVSPKTVKFHLTHLYLKAGAKSCREFIVKILPEKMIIDALPKGTGIIEDKTRPSTDVKID